MEVSESKALKGTDPNFPDSGVIRISGENSALSLSAIDNVHVQLDLDSNKDGVTDSSKMVA